MKIAGLLQRVKSSYAGARILLVEDDEINQQVALELLRQAHFNVDLAENGRIALTRLQAQNYDLVLMDVQMPVMDGIAATVELRGHPRYAKLPIVAMAGNVLAADQKRCLDAGMNDFIAKPVEPEQLWQVLLKWIPVRHAPTPLATISPNDTPSNATFNLNIHGIDPITALRRMLGNTELYTSTLRKFCEFQENMPVATRVALDADDWITAQRRAHTLKGVAGSIGANRLAADAALLEQALAEHWSRGEADKLIDTLEVQLLEMIANVRLGLPPAGSVVITDQAGSAEAMAAFEALLADSDPEAVAWLDRNTSVMSVLLSASHLAKIQAAVNTCDFDDALHLLRKAHLTEQEFTKEPLVNLYLSNQKQPTPTLTLPLKGREHGSSPFKGEVGRGMGGNAGDMIKGIFRISVSLTKGNS
jgi:two-component system sensor histidine kinase/response regulator